jgi:hypothetical protein
MLCIRTIPFLPIIIIGNTDIIYWLLAGVTPGAVGRTLSGLRVMSPVYGAQRHRGEVRRYSDKRQTTKSPVFRPGFLLCLMPGSLWRASCPPPSGPLLRNVQIRSRRICPGQESATDKQQIKQKAQSFD